MHANGQKKRAFTIVELIVVIGIIGVLVALILPAMTSALRSSSMSETQVQMRQVSQWMKLYASDHADTIVPSQFNHQDSGYPGKSRRIVSIGEQYRGTWTDILWVNYALVDLSTEQVPISDPLAYAFDSPDSQVFDLIPGFNHPFRTRALNSANSSSVDGSLPLPYGPGASEAGLPGYIAANNFFNADASTPTWNPSGSNGGLWSNAHIQVPTRAMYLVDSLAGEVIEPIPGAFEGDSREVDFRYNNACVMLFLDGHTSPEYKWDAMCDLEGVIAGDEEGRGIRVRQLHLRSNPCP